MIRALLASWAVLALLAGVEPGCAKNAAELYPFPCGADQQCPNLPELPAMGCAPAVGCLVFCRAETLGGCIDLDGNPVDVGDREARCLFGAGAGVDNVPTCVVLCDSDDDCNADYQRCNGAGFCVLANDS